MTNHENDKFTMKDCTF